MRPDIPITNPRIRRGVNGSFKNNHAAGSTHKGVVYANTIDFPAGMYCKPTLTKTENPTICNQPILKMTGRSARTGMRNCLVARHTTKKIMHMGTSRNAVTQTGETNSRDFLAMTQFTPQIITSKASRRIARCRREASDCISIVAKATRCIWLDSPNRRGRKMRRKNQIARARMLLN